MEQSMVGTTNNLKLRDRGFLYGIVMSRVACTGQSTEQLNKKGGIILGAKEISRCDRIL